MEEPERVLQTLKGEKWRMEERSGLERWIWEPHGETVLVEDVGLNQLDGGEFVEMENKTAEGKLARAGVCVEGRVLQQKEYDDPEKEQRKRW